jgi:hypothetical protein
MVVNEKSLKAQCIIILHAITPFGPVCERVDSVPTDDLMCKGDTAHSTPQSYGLMTAEYLWKSQSNSGDYHQNMSSKMFLKLLQEILMPTMGRLHPSKKIVLVCDNAPYHHKQENGS